VPVEHKIGEQESALASGQAVVEADPVPLEDGSPAQLDPVHRTRRQGHANILTTLPAYTTEEDEIARIIRCECGFVARGDTDSDVIATIRGHLETDHPDLLETVGRQDLLGWIQVE